MSNTTSALQLNNSSENPDEDEAVAYNPVLAEDASKWLSRTILDLLLQEPFYAHVLQNMTRSITTAVKTAAVTYRNEQLMLLVNPDFFGSLTTDQRRGLLKHEVLHIILNHLFRPENKQGESRLLLNLAADIVVNQLVKASDLPPQPVTLTSFPKLKLEPNKNTAYYLAKLKEYIEKNCRMSTGIAVIFEASHSDHSGWTDGGAESAAARLAVADLVERAKDAARRRGNLPANLMQQLALEKEASALIPWKQVLRRFLQRTGLTSIRYSKKRISRRFGTRPGIKIQRQLRLLVAIDTSGSVSEPQLTEFFTEINGMVRFLSEVWIIECDCTVHRYYKYRRGTTTVKVTGRGGTDLDPVFEFVNDHPEMVDAVVYLTDGYANQPKVTPVKPVLLVINNRQHQLKPARHLSIIEFQSKNVNT